LTIGTATNSSEVTNFIWQIDKLLPSLQPFLFLEISFVFARFGIGHLSDTLLETTDGDEKSLLTWMVKVIQLPPLTAHLQ